MTNRKDNIKQLNSAKIHLETAHNFLSVVSNQFSKRAYNAAVHGDEIDSDTLDIQGALSDMLEALNKVTSLLTTLIEGM